MNMRAGLAQGSNRTLAQRPAGVPSRAPWHPGQFLRRHFLAPVGLSQTDAARVLGISRRRLHEIVQGQRSMTPDTAIRCAVAFGTDAAFWLALQAAWDNFHAYQSLRRQNRPAAGAAPTARALPTRWVASSSFFASRFPGSA